MASEQRRARAPRALHATAFALFAFLLSVDARAADADATAPEAMATRSSAAAEPELLAALARWLDAWRARDVQAFVASYAPGYAATGLTRDDWARGLGMRLPSKAWIEIDAADVTVTMGSADRARVEYRQSYRDPRYADTSRKVIDFERFATGWRIVKEQALDLRALEVQAQSTRVATAQRRPMAAEAESMAAPQTVAESPPAPAADADTDSGVAEEQVARATAGIPPASDLCAPRQAPDARRRRPGSDEGPTLRYELPVCDPGRIEPWTQAMELGPAVPDRWRIVQALGYKEQIWDPYNTHNPIKGDLPIWGEDWFFSVTAISDTIVEPRRFPVPVGISTTARPDSLDLIGRGRSTVMATTLLTEFVFYKGNTTFKPPDWEFRFIPVINYNEVHFDERGVLKVQPGGADISGRVRKEGHLGIQGLFVDKHLRNVGDRYDFDSLRVGIQPIAADFRGFLFQDQQLGIRLFGTRDNNIFQYNLAAFQRMEKDTNTQLNNHGEALRDDWVFMANLYWQDFPTRGHTSQVTVVHNTNREKGQVKFDDNGFIARPASIFQERFARDYDVTYLGFNGDGHFGRYNLTTSFYWALGQQTNDRFRGADDEINAQFFAAELSTDRDWQRYRLSALWASGDDDPFDDEATGFDAIFENPLFAGADTSFWIRQPVPLIGGGGVSITGRNGVLNSLRSSKENGQSNFINPGTVLLGVGGDFDVTPETRISVNVNQLWFQNSSVVEAVRNQGNIDEDIGLDMSVSVIWRPTMIQNVVFRLSGAMLLPGEGFEDLFGQDDENPYSVLANLVLMY